MSAVSRSFRRGICPRRIFHPCQAFRSGVPVRRRDGSRRSSRIGRPRPVWRRNCRNSVKKNFCGSTSCHAGSSGLLRRLSGRSRRKKDEKKSRKNLEVKKKGVPLQSRSGRGAAREARETRRDTEKSSLTDWRESKQAIPKDRIRERRFRPREGKERSAGTDLEE